MNSVRPTVTNSVAADSTRAALACASACCSPERSSLAIGPPALERSAVYGFALIQPRPPPASKSFFFNPVCTLSNDQEQPIGRTNAQNANDDCCCVRGKGCHSAPSVVRHAMAQGTSLGAVIVWPAQLARPIPRRTRVNRVNRVSWSQEGDHVGVYGSCSSEQQYSLV